MTRNDPQSQGNRFSASRPPLGRPRAAVLLLLLVALALTAGCTASPSRAPSPADRSAELPEFPDYAAADAFLEMQARQRRYQPPPQENAYTDHSQRIYEDIQSRLQYSAAEMELRAQLQAEALRRNRAANLQEWDAMQGRLQHDLALDAARDAEIAASTARNQRKFQARYDQYRSRLERLAMETEQRDAERELNAIRNQQRMQARLEELRAKQDEAKRVVDQAREDNTFTPGVSPTGRVGLPGTGAAATERLAPESAAR